MSRAVRFDHYGDRHVLYIADVAIPTPAEDEVLVRVRAAGINPGRSTSLSQPPTRSNTSATYTPNSNTITPAARSSSFLFRPLSPSGPLGLHYSSDLLTDPLTGTNHPC